MNRILVMLPMVLSAVFGGTIVPAENSASQQRPVASTSGTGVGIQKIQPYSPQPAGSSSQGVAVPPPSQIYYPTYPEYEPGYSVQTGYEGYLVPANTPAPQSTWGSGLWAAMSPVSRFALSYGTRAGIYVLNLMLLLVLGGIFTTSVCTFTPLCTITILGLGKAQVKEQVTELARTYITPERISAATSLVKRAIDKYAAMQRQPEKVEEAEKLEDKS